jgi:hypothetical protein
LRFLFDDGLAPMTSEIGFAEVELERAVAFVDDRTGSSTRRRGGRLTEERLSVDLAAGLERLLPLTLGEESRILLMVTDSPWVAYFENTSGGADPASVMSVLAMTCGCRTLRVAAIPDTIRSETGRGGRHGGSMLEIYGPQVVEFQNVVRLISAINDGSRWRFDLEGEEQPFERPEHYTRRTIRRRFPFELLAEYLDALGVRAFDEDFYGPEAVLFERTGMTPDPQEISLEEVRRAYTDYD